MAQPFAASRHTVVLAIVCSWIPQILSFAPHRLRLECYRRPPCRRYMILDPSHWTDISTIPTLLVPHATHSIDALWSTLYSSSKVMLQQPAHGHSQPLFGPADSYLTAGQSIAPPAANLLNMDITDSRPAAISSHSDQLVTAAQVASQKGWKLLDVTAIRPHDVLPGFARTRGMLPEHDATVVAATADSPASLRAQVQWAASFLNVIDKLPYVVISYAMLEFWILRPNLDVYGEDVQHDGARVTVEFVITTAVRVVAFCVVAAVTTTLFG